MKKSKVKTERTFATTLIEAQQPPDLSMFCELIAQQILSDKNFMSKEIIENERKVY